MRNPSFKMIVESNIIAASEANAQGDDPATRYYLAQAADAAGEIEDDRSRRTAWSVVAKHAINTEYPELSQQLARKLIRLDRKIGRISWVITDLLSYGSSLHLTGQHIEAEEVYRQAFDLAVEIESWQRAAAASTNYAAAIAMRGKLEEARRWLERSLEYLHREPNLDTEFRTRSMMIEVMHLSGEEPTRCFAAARKLIDDHKADLSRGYCVILQKMLDPILKSYFTDHPTLHPQRWIGEHFPELMEAGYD